MNSSRLLVVARELSLSCTGQAVLCGLTLQNGYWQM